MLQISKTAFYAKHSGTRFCTNVHIIMYKSYIFISCRNKVKNVFFLKKKKKDCIF